jgi:hypothetical protein
MMSFDMWHASIYGVELPKDGVSARGLAEWLTTNAERLELTDDERECVGEDVDRMLDMLEDRSDTGAGIAEAVATVVDVPNISATRGSFDEDAEIVGVFACEVYPWTYMPEEYHMETREQVEWAITAELRKLYGCGDFEPVFSELDVTYWG